MTSPSRALDFASVSEGLAGELLARGSSIQVEVRGGCMRPWAFSGDRLEVAPLRGPIRPGMILLVHRAGRLSAHRAVGVAAGRVRTRGDLERQADPWIDRRAVLGQVVAVRSRLLRRVVRLDGLAPRWLGRLSAPLWRGLRRAVQVARRS